MDPRLSRRRFIILTAGVGLVPVGGCLSSSGDDPVAIIVHNETSYTQHLQVRLFRPGGESIDTYSYALGSGDSVEGIHTVSGEIGEIAVSAQAQDTFEELPDARTQYSPATECEDRRPDVVITLRDEGISFSYAC